MTYTVFLHYTRMSFKLSILLSLDIPLSVASLQVCGKLIIYMIIRISFMSFNAIFLCSVSVKINVSFAIFNYILNTGLVNLELI